MFPLAINWITCRLINCPVFGSWNQTLLDRLDSINYFWSLGEVLFIWSYALLPSLLFWLLCFSHCCCCCCSCCCCCWWWWWWPLPLRLLLLSLLLLLLLVAVVGCWYFSHLIHFIRASASVRLTWCGSQAPPVPSALEWLWLDNQEITRGTMTHPPVCEFPSLMNYPLVI